MSAAKATSLRGDRPTGRARGFTLVEMLVVLAIIALIMGASLPSIRVLFTSGADAQAYNLLSAQLRAARGLAVQQQTHAAVHIRRYDDGLPDADPGLTGAFFVVLLGVSSVILLLYGSGYVFMLPLMGIFVLTSVLLFAFSIFTWFASSIGIRGVWVTTISTATVSVFAITLSYLLIPAAGLYGAAISMLVSYSIGTVVAFMRVRSLVRRAQ